MESRRVTQGDDRRMNEAQDAIANRANAEAPPPLPTRAEAFRYWLRLGFISFGGPAGQIAIMHRELVDEKRWISERRFLHALNFCMLLPGPEATQLATYIGWLLHRTWGGLVAGILFVLPSLAILVALSWLYVTYGSLPIVAGVLYGIKPAVVAIVLHAAWRIGSRALKHPLLWLVAAAAFVAIFVFSVPFPLIVVAAGVLGAIGGRWTPAAFAPADSGMKRPRAHPSALIDDDTPTPSHARYTRSRVLGMVGVFVLLWGAILLALTAQWGWSGTLTQMAWFFTKAALVTFGGAYAVLPYVYQGAVETYGWLVPSQMIDGLALGETTPGPLIMIVAFVGFVGAWTHAIFGGDLRFAAGAAGACVATFFTFLPSYLFILAGAPLIESTHGQLRFTAPLTAITAAVVGVIVNLALFFAWHVLWPEGWQAGAALGGMAVSVLLIGMAAVALFRFKIGVIPVIVGCGIAGLIVARMLNA
jgi:chromate transporter